MQHRVPLYSGPMMISKLWLKFAQSIRWSLIRFYKHSFNLLLHFNRQIFYSDETRFGFMWTLVGEVQQFSQGEVSKSFRSNFENWKSFVKSPKISDKLWTLKFFSRKYKHLMKGSDKVSLPWNHLEWPSFQSTSKRLILLPGTQVSIKILRESKFQSRF